MTNTEKPLTSDEALVLRELCKCENGKGTVLLKHWRRAGNGLIRKGLAWSLNGGFGDVYIVNDKGRAALAKAEGR